MRMASSAISPSLAVCDRRLVRVGAFPRHVEDGVDVVPVLLARRHERDPELAVATASVAAYRSALVFARSTALVGVVTSALPGESSFRWT